MQVVRFALRNLWRDLKSGELSVLLLALTVAVLSLTAVGFFTSRISQGVRAQAAEVLAADLRLESPTPIPARYFTEAQARGLKSARLLSFPTAIFSGNLSQLAALNDQVAKISDPQIKQLLQGMIARCGGDMGRLKTDLANWFDNAMDRLSGDFKRRTQVMTFVIALVTALVINLDTIRVGTLLWGQTGLADELKSITIPSAPTDVNGVIGAEKQVIDALDKLAQEGFPVGWAPGHFMDVEDTPGHWEAIWNEPPSIWYRPLLGWLITAVAALFGAPFWFDALQSIIRLKGAGPSPDEKATNRAASS